MITILYQDANITITEDFLRVARLQDKVIPWKDITGARQERSKIGDFKPAAGFFILLTVISAFAFPLLCIFFIPLAIAAYFTNKYKFTLIVGIKGYDTRIYDSELPVTKPVRLIRSRVKMKEKIASFAST